MVPPNLGFVHVQFLLSDCGEATSDFQRDVNVTAVLAENSSVVCIDLRHRCCGLGFHRSGPCVHQEVEQKHTQRATLNDAV